VSCCGGSGRMAHHRRLIEWLKVAADQDGLALLGGIARH
jgi:hypothetical protein